MPPAAPLPADYCRTAYEVKTKVRSRRTVKSKTMTEMIDEGYSNVARSGRFSGWLSAVLMVAGILSLPIYTVIADALAPRHIFPLPAGGWPLPGIRWFVAAVSLIEILALAAGIYSRGTRSGRVGLYGAASALLFGALWVLAATLSVPS